VQVGHLGAVPIVAEQTAVLVLVFLKNLEPNEGLIQTGMVE
jgi:hypothetical protein